MVAQEINWDMSRCISLALNERRGTEYVEGRGAGLTSSSIDVKIVIIDAKLVRLLSESGTAKFVWPIYGGRVFLQIAETSGVYLQKSL